MHEFNGLGMHVGNLWRLSDAGSRSISPENFTGEKGKGGMATMKVESASLDNMRQNVLLAKVEKWTLLNMKSGHME